MTQSKISQSFDGQFSSIQNSNGSSLDEDTKKSQLLGQYIEANMQITSRKAGKALTLSRPHPHPSKDTSFTLA